MYIPWYMNIVIHLIPWYRLSTFFVRISQYHVHYLIGAKTLEGHTLEIINYEVLKALNVRMLVDARSNST